MNQNPEFRKFEYKKLVRDNILDSMLDSGSKVTYRELTGQEYIEALKAKFLEEAAELEPDDQDELFKEISDLQEVLDCLVAAIGKTKADVQAAQIKKIEKAGSFKRGIYVDTVSVRPDDPWLEYLSNNPDRYKEISSE